MNRDERTADIEQALRVMNDTIMRSLLIVLPVRVVAYDGNDKPPTVSVQPTVQVRRQNPNGQVVNESLPKIPRAPVHFVGGGGFTLTHPISEGDEGHIVVSSRCFESWMEQGDIQPMAHARYHDLTDAIYIPGLRSKPRSLENLSTNSVQLRSDNGNAVLDFKEDRMELTFAGGGKFTFKADGTFEASGEIEAKHGTGNSIKVTTHKHSGVMTGGGQTLQPVPGT
jgi:hypothetical protein